MKQGSPLKILIVDDHALVRAGFRAILERVEQVKEIKEAANGREAIQVSKKFQPDIVLMDISMPELNGLDTTIILKDQSPDIAVIILSMYAEEDYLQKAQSIGIQGYLLKDADLNELRSAIQVVSQGKTYISSRISIKYKNEAYSSELTIRQREVLQLIAEGKNSKQIGQILNISPKTADAHRFNIMKKLKITDIASLVRYAIQTGLVRP